MMSDPRVEECTGNPDRSEESLPETGVQQSATSPRAIRVALGRLARRTTWACLTLVLLFAGLDYIINYRDWADDRSIRRIFNVAREGSMPSWFSSTLLLCSGTVALLVVLLLRAQRKPRVLRLGWGVIAAFFVFMAIDDASAIHERVGSALKRYFEADPETQPALVRSLLELPSYSWQAFLLPIFGAVGLFMTVFLWGQLGLFRLRKYAVIGMSCFVTAVGMDYVEGLDGAFERAAAYLDVKVYAVSHCSKVIEETLEMIGATLFLGGFLRYLAAIAEGSRILLVGSAASWPELKPSGLSMTAPFAGEADAEPMAELENNPDDAGVQPTC